VHPSIQYIEKIINKNKDLTVEETSKSATTLFSKLKYNNNIYILMVKEAFEDKVVVNATNPVNFDDLPEEKNLYEVANKFNTYAIGVKCIKLKKGRGSFIFTREEIFSIKDCKNEKLINQKLLLSFEMLSSAPELFSTYLEESDEQN